MSEDGLDDELIALVGEDAPTQHDAPLSHDKRSALLSDLSDDEDAEGEKTTSRRIRILLKAYTRTRTIANGCSV